MTVKYLHCAALTIGIFAPLQVVSATPDNSNVETFYGSYNSQLPITVPKFFGITPQLALSYSSSGGNGFVGVGWQLEGFSSIERKSVGRGAPAFSADDIYILDGQELVADTTLGGTHATKIQSYMRITRSDDEWRIVRKDGTITIYKPLYRPFDHAEGTLKWGISQVIDTSGNTVDYEWWCDLDADCYPSAVTYGATSIRLYRERRPDVIAFANARQDVCEQVCWETMPAFSGSVECWDGSVQQSLGALHGSGDTITVKCTKPLGPTLPDGTLTVSGGVTVTGEAPSPWQVRAVDNLLTTNAWRNGRNYRELHFHGATASGGGNFGYDHSGLWPEHATRVRGEGNQLVFSRDDHSVAITFEGETLCPARCDLAPETGGRTRYRLRTIDVTVQGQPARAYSLLYDISSATTRSRLKAVRMYGTDRTLDADGQVTAGTSLPAISMDYDNTPGGFAAPQNWRSAELLGNKDDALPMWGHGKYTNLVDMNGDGQSDYVAHYNYHTKQYGLWVLMNNGSGFDAPVNWRSADLLGNKDDALPRWGEHTNLVDINGDGRPDYVAHYNYHTKQYGLWVLLNRGDGFDDPVNWNTASLLGHNEHANPRNGNGEKTTLIDMNGDGLLDFVSHYNHHAKQYGLWVLMNNGSGFDAPVNWRSADLLGNKNDALAGWGDHTSLVDINGDGRPDYVAQYNYHTKQYGLWVLLNRGDGFDDPVNWNTASLLGHNEHANPRNGNGEKTTLIDMNGDGLLDFVSHYNHHAKQYGLWVLLNNGGGFTQPRNWGTAEMLGHNGMAGPSWESTYSQLTDMNGDGRPDFVAHHNYHDPRPLNGLWVLINNGSGFEPPQLWNSAQQLGHNNYGRPANGRGQYSQLVDMNGDGLSDYVANHNHTAGNPGLWVLLNTGSPPDLLTSLDNGLGGTTRIAYTPSTTWENTNRPPLVHTVTSVADHDGRGNVATTHYQYSGGLYDPLERRFLGFHKTTVTQPCVADETACPYEVTQWAQDYGSVSKPMRIDEFAGDGRLLQSTQLEYETNGSTVPYTSQQVAAWNYVYDDSGQSRRSSVTRQFDDYGNIVQEVIWGDYDLEGDERTVQTSFAYNFDEFIVAKTNAVSVYAGTTPGEMLLSQTLTYYDDNDDWEGEPTTGKATQAAIWLNTTNGYAVTTAEYDSWGNVVREVDALGNATTHVMDESRQFVVSTTNALGHREDTDWDPQCGVRTRMVAANGAVTTRTLDALCRVVRIDLPGGGWETRSYGSYSDATLTSYMETRTPGPNSNDNWRRTYRDGHGQVWRVDTSGPSGDATIHRLTDYDARGNVARVSAPHYSGEEPWWTETRYDARDRLIAMIHADGSRSDTTYSLGFTMTIDELGNRRTESRDIDGNVVERREGPEDNEIVTTYTYDLSGNLASAIDSEGNVASYQYDSLRRRVESRDPNLGEWRYEYNANGKLVAQRDAKGQQTTYEYDPGSRRIAKTTLAGTAKAETVTWTYDESRDGYDNTGRVTTMTDSVGSETYDYDAAGRVVRSVRTVDGVAYNFRKGYDVAGRPLWTEFPDGDSLGSPKRPLRYDDAGRLISIPDIVEHARYDAAGRMVEQVNANGTVTRREFSRQRGWLEGISTEHGGETIQKLSYARDAAGQIVAVTSPFPGEGWTYQYDEMNRLVGANSDSEPSATEQFSYSENGNLTSRTWLGGYEYGEPGASRPHAVTRAGGYDYTYDANGNMTAGRGRVLRWDGDNQLRSVNSTTFAYDGNGARIKQSRNGVSTLYLGDYEVSDGRVAKYIHLAGVLVAKRTEADTLWFHTDHQGSTQAITNVDGNVVHRKTYRPYGELLATTGDGMESRGYTGQRLDDSGLIYLNARYYDPVLGRFISPDPTVPTTRSVGLNRYAYAANNPVSHTDIDGLGFFKKLKKKFKKLLKKLKRIPKKLSRAFAKVASKLSRIPVVGGLLAMSFSYYSALLAGDWRNAARIGATAAVMFVAAALTVATGGLATPLYIAANAVIGFTSGFAIAAVNGAGMKAALRAGALGAAMSAGSAALSRASQAIADSKLVSPTTKNVAAMGDGLGTEWNQEGGWLLGPLNNGPTSGPANLAAFGHETAMKPLFDAANNGTISQGLYSAINVSTAVPMAAPVYTTATGVMAVGTVASTMQSTGLTQVVVGDMARVHGARSAARRRSASTLMAAGAQ